MENIIIRDFQNSDAEDVVELIRANYGDTYYRKAVYNPQHWIEMTAGRKNYSIVAELENRVVGQFLLMLNDKFSAEIGAVVVHPDFKGIGIMNKMFDYLIEVAQRLNLSAIYGEAIMFHPFSQKANLRHHLVETALQLGEVSSWVAQKDKQFHKRSATLVAYKIFNKQKRAVFIPTKYRKIIKPIYQKLGLKPIKMVVKPLKKGIVFYEKKNLKIGVIVINGIENNFEKRFNSIFSKMRLKNEMIYCDINLSEPQIDKITNFANKKGFFYSGILFYRYNGSDYLRLQFENKDNIEEKTNICYSDYCKFLTKFVLKDGKITEK